MDYIDECGGIIPSEAQSVLGLKASRIREVLSSLCDVGLLERVGAKRNSRYMRKGQPKGLLFQAYQRCLYTVDQLLFVLCLRCALGMGTSITNSSL